MIQFEELCRLCAQNKRNKLDLFAEEDEGTKTLLANISMCLSVHITREDMLPKMVCCDCQRLTEQFNAFRVKCLKAEERLNKMLVCSVPNKLMVTRIKEECLETEFNEHPEIQREFTPENESVPVGMKPMKNVKLEVYKSDEENISIENYIDTPGPDLVRIISEEIVNHNNQIDIKQPIIEVISENFIDDFKSRNHLGFETNSLNDEAIVDKSCWYEPSQICTANYNVNALNQCLDPGAVIQVKMQEPDSENEQQNFAQVNEEKTTGEDCAKRLNNGKLNRRRRRDTAGSDVEIDKKYLFLGEGEECDIDLEEMDALIKKKKNPNARFDCKTCKRSFKFFKCWKKHRSVHENEPGTFICDICRNTNAKNFEFSSLACLKNHMKRKHLQGSSNKFKCHLCNKILTSQIQLNVHFRKVHDNSGASCRVCGKAFKNKARLTDHMKVHRQDRPYVCDQCGQSFKWNGGLKIHIQSHKQEKNFLCSDCGKKFSAKKNLLEHLNIHAGKRPHVCQFCNASFTQLSAYSRHLYTHNQEMKLHKCDKCEKNFSHSYLLKQHKLQHSAIRPYSCSVCSNSFKSRSGLCTHLKIHQEKKYPCSVCGRKFSRSKTLRDHMVRHTGIKHICPVPGCGKAYTQRFPLTKHFYKSHPSLKIINRSGGKKAHIADKIMNDLVNYPDIDFIRYDYKPKHE